MTPLGHALVGYYVAGPAGVAVSLLPDLPLAAAHWLVGGRRLPDTHPALQLHAWLHCVTGAAPILAVIVVGTGLPPGPLALCWLLHILTDLVTHPLEDRWHPILPTRLSY